MLVLIGDDPSPVIGDPFRGGMLVDGEGMAALLAVTTDGATAPMRRVAAMPNRAILVRLLLNQATRAEAAGLERLAQHDKRFLGKVVGRHHVVGFVEVDRVDLVAVDELGQLELT